MKSGFSIVLVALWLACPAVAGAVDLQLTQVANRNGVVDIANAGDGTGRLFLVEQPGRIFILNGVAELATPFLDIRSKVRDSGNEEGLLSLAFAPDYPQSGIFYVWYTIPSGHNVIERYAVGPNPNLADADSGDVILDVAHPFSNHNGGRLRFGPDGMLYLGVGDGGGSFDPERNGQDGDTLLGKLIRIDVDPGHGDYAIPPSNPFVGVAGVRDEIWALGLRNPWRISFDPNSGDLFIADVGQNQIEEINFQPAASAGGENYGWSIMEGSQCVNAGCNQSGLTLPVTTYTHGTGCSVTGGEVYRGEAYPNLVGVYFFADYCSGRIWGLERSGGQWQMSQLLDSDLEISTFGLGEDGSVYLAGRNDGVYLLSDGQVQPEPDFLINAGLNDSWFNPATAGQGFFITVFPVTRQVFLAWFTYDTERPTPGVEAILAEPGHRWLTAFGSYAGDAAELEIELTHGGVFDTSPPTTAQEPDGTIRLEFDNCNSGRVIYDISSTGSQGTIPIQRLAPDNLAACEALNLGAIFQ